MVCVTVGGSPSKDFQVPEGLLRSSPYFEKMFSGGWKEAEERHAVLTSEKVVAFEIYLMWLYSGRIMVDEAESDVISLENLIEAFFLGDRLQHVEFKDSCIDAILASVMRQHYKVLPKPSIVYAETPEGSSLRKLTLHLHFARHDSTSLRKWYPKYTTEEFLLEMCTMFLDEKQTHRGSFVTRQPP